MHPSLIFGQRPTEPDVTLDEFLTELYNSPRLFHLSGRDIRDEFGYCPLTSLVNQKGLGSYNNGIASITGEMALGLPATEGTRIVWAADDWNIEPLSDLAELRQKLLRACKLA